MKADFTRWTFRPEEHYHGVLKQQGRVDLDADWNEQVAITSHRIEVETLDVVGASGAPQANAGFTLKPTPGGGLTITKGRAYVDGILCENEADVSISAQPDFPGFTVPTAPGFYLAYLQVWLRHITALDDPEIHEVALGGPDTCTRARTIWQVGLLPVPATFLRTCSEHSPQWDQLVAASSITLAARAEPDPAATDPCAIPVQAGYRRLENQLYRVEIHDGSTAPAPSFKWSRDNGSVVTRAVSWPPGTTDQITVASTGPDSVLGFAAGQWIELTDDTSELNFRPGTMVQLANVTGNTLRVNLATATGPIDEKHFPSNPKVRRWDANPAQLALQPVTSASWLNLESGVQVQFTSGTYKTGDYWMIPARTLTANVDWSDVNGVPAAEPPKGIRRHFCRLAVLEWNGNAWGVHLQCLPVFPPLIGFGSGVKAIHVTAVSLLTNQGTRTPVNNDATLPIGALQNAAIEAVCDTAINPACAKLPVCFVTVDLPHFAAGSFAPSPDFAFQQLILNNTVFTSGGNALVSAFNPAALTFIQEYLKQHPEPLLVHFTLKGAKVWSREDPNIYLDGQAFGLTLDKNIGLRLPSGGGLRASDFEMWFWVGPDAAPVLT